MTKTLTKRAALSVAFVLPLALAVAAAPFPRAVGPEAPMAAVEGLTDSYCDARQVVSGTLSHDFAERPALAALTGTGMTMELRTSDLLGTWTLVHHGADGISCIVTSGMDWQAEGDAVALMDEALAEAVHGS